MIQKLMPVVGEFLFADGFLHAGVIVSLRFLALSDVTGGSMLSMMQKSIIVR